MKTQVIRIFVMTVLVLGLALQNTDIVYMLGNTWQPTVSIASTFVMPLEWLADKSNRWEFNIFGRNHSVIFFHPYEGELLWGATARMTVEFLNTVTVRPPP